MSRTYVLTNSLPAQFVMADAAYDADRLRQIIADEGSLAVIPSSPRAREYPVDKHLRAARHLIGCSDGRRLCRLDLAPSVGRPWRMWTLTAQPMLDNDVGSNMNFT